LTAADFLTALEWGGLTVTAKGGKLLVSPAGLLMDEDRADLTRMKPELIALLNRREADRVCSDLGPNPPPVPRAETVEGQR
jgi:hypothetical protein